MCISCKILKNPIEIPIFVFLQHCTKFCPNFAQEVTSSLFFLLISNEICWDSININNLCCNQVVLEKVGKTLWVQFVQKRSHCGPHQKWKTFFWAKANKADYQLSETFYFIKTSYVLTEL